VPRGTPADQLYNQLVAEGYTKKDAAKEAQKRTGLSLVSGKPVKQKQLKFTSKGVTFGQQDTLKRKHSFGVFT